MANQDMKSEFLEQIKEEHAELGRMVSGLRVAITAGRDMRQLRERLEKVKTELIDHFALEEEGGYFRDILAEAPHLSADAEHLHGQHQDLMQQIKALCVVTQDDDASSEKWSQIVTEVDEFIDFLKEHERGENKLVQDAYQLDIGSKD